MTTTINETYIQEFIPDHNYSTNTMLRDAVKDKYNRWIVEPANSDKYDDGLKHVIN